MSENLSEKSLKQISLESLLDSSLDVIIRISTNAFVHYASSSLINLIGYLPADLYDKSLIAFISEDQVDSFKIKLSEILQSEKIHTFNSALINNRMKKLLLSFL